MANSRDQRNFDTMAAASSHRDDSPDSLFLPANHQHDTHYDNERAARRRRIMAQPERRGERLGSVHYPIDGLDFRRPVMSAGARERSMSVAGPAVAAPPVIDLTEENEGESEGTLGARGGEEMTGASEANMVGEPSRATGNQRLPRFGRDVIDVEEANPIHHHSYNDLRPRALESEDDDGAYELPGANFLALPPRRSASGRVQYSTLRRPTRPPSPPQEMDDEEIEYMGSRSFGHGVPLAPPLPRHARPRSVTPYPDDPHMPVAIDLTDDVEDEDDVQFVDERQVHGVNAARPELGAGNRTQAGEPGGFGIGRLANLLRPGRLAQRVQDFANNRDAARPFEHMDGDQMHARRNQLEQHMAAHREHREHLRQREVFDGRPGRTPPAPRRQMFVPTVPMRPDGTMPGYRVMGARPRPAGARPPRPAPFLGDLGDMMNYGMAAFDMGYGGNDNRPPTPKYSPPPEPAEGFTRNPAEDEVVVCPNCGDELAVGAEEAKQEIWVVKSCGHVSSNSPNLLELTMVDLECNANLVRCIQAYCGDCALHRTKTKSSKKGKDRVVDAEVLPPPFKNCVVQGCGKSASARSMVRVYFGS